MDLQKLKKESKDKMKNAKMPEFKYGLNIFLKPEDFDLEKIKIKENKDMIKFDEKEIEEFLSKEWEIENTKVDYFNFSNMNKLTFIAVPKNNLNKEIELEIEEKENFIHYIFILLNENSKSKITIKKTGNPKYASENIRIIAKENSNLEMLNIENFKDKTINFEKRILFIGQNAKIKLFDLSLGSNYTRSETTSFLKENNSEIEHIIIYLSRKDELKDLFSSAIHLSKETKSELKTKGALKGYSKVLSRSTIKIEENAENSNGYEKQDALILNEGAESDAMPQLEIKNPNVKCSHGSSVGQIDKEKLFYLMSRGLNMDLAKKKIVEGYFESTLSLINDEKTKNHIREIINEKL